jgi:HEAT repeat protein
MALACVARADVGAEIAKLPGDDAAAAAKIAQGLLKQGAPAVKEICGKLVPAGGGDDTKARYAITAMVHAAAKNAAERTMLASALADFLGTEADPEVKTFVITQLLLIARDESVPALAKLLVDEKVCDVAAMGLERIGSAAASDALVKALPDAKDGRRAAIIKSVGALRATSAVAEIVRSTNSDNTRVRHAAVWALANMGAAEARGPLATMLEDGRVHEQALAADWLILLAERFAAAGNKKDAEALCRALAVRGNIDVKHAHIAGAALHGLVKVLGERAMDDLLAAVDSPSVEIRSAALDAAATIKGEAATAKWAAKLKTANGPAKVDLLAFLARRGDPSAMEVIEVATKDADAAVRATALHASVKLAGDAAIPLLISALKSKDAGDIKTASDLMSRMPGDKALAAMAGALTDLPAPAKIAAIDVLAARSAAAHCSAVLSAAASDDAGVRLAALRAIERVASSAEVTAVIDLAIIAKSDADEAAALKSAVALAAQIEPVDARADAFLAALPSAQGAKRAALLRSLARLGGAKALAAVSADLKSDDKAVKDAALRALADWPDDSAVAPLLEVAKSDAPLAQQVIAIRGVTQVLKNSKSSSADKVKLYGQALASAKRPDEKKLVLAALSSERTAESLDLAASLLSDESLKGEAALAVIKIAAPLERGQKGLTGAKVIEALKLAIPLCPDASAKSAAERHLASLERRN